MLELKPVCECCGMSLGPAATGVYICTFECTWCADCARSFQDGACLNCGGNLVERPIRPPHLLVEYPPTTQITVKARCP